LCLCRGAQVQKLLQHDVGFEVLTPVVMKSTIFWDTTLCSPLKVNRRFGETYRLPYAFTLVFCSAHFSTLKMEAIYSSETSVDLQRTIRRYIPEDSVLATSLQGRGIYCTLFVYAPKEIRCSHEIRQLRHKENRRNETKPKMERE
jgi:hypothetical protein